jgi:predicted RNase H-like nuclease
MQPANTGRQEMFGMEAPLWSFLERFGGAADPSVLSTGTRVFETYPVLVLISLGWTLPDSRPTGRLPKYNPARTGTFSRSDWEYVCLRVRDALLRYGLVEISQWVGRASAIKSPRKADQDRLDACLCLLAALHVAKGNDCLVVGDRESGYIVVPHSTSLCSELEIRCKKIRLTPSDWIRACRMH